MTGDWDLAEECAQDAFAQALERWPRDGVPRNPGAWLTTTARNRALDRLRRAHDGRGQAAGGRRCCPAPTSPHDDDSGVEDDRLRLIFTCCHPALSVDAQVALTLRTLGGPDDGRDRARVPRARTDDGAAPRARQAQDPQRGDPVPRAARAPAARANAARCSPCSTCCSTRATPRPRAPTSCAPGLCAKRSGWPARSPR